MSLNREAIERDAERYTLPFGTFAGRRVITVSQRYLKDYLADPDLEKSYPVLHKTIVQFLQLNGHLPIESPVVEKPELTAVKEVFGRVKGLTDDQEHDLSELVAMLRAGDDVYGEITALLYPPAKDSEPPKKVDKGKAVTSTTKTK